MKFIDTIADALGLVDEEEVYEDEVEEKAKPKKEKSSFFSRKEKEAPAPAEEPKKEKPAFSFHKKAQEEAPAPAEEPKKGGFLSRFKKSDNEEKEAAPVKTQASYKDRKRMDRTINLPIDNKQVNVVMMEPVDFNECPKIADYLRNSQPVVVNFEGTDNVLTKRMTDFISGVVYALNGSMKKIGRNILVCAPRNVDIDAEAGYENRGDQSWKH